MSSDVDVYVAVGERDVLAGRLYPHRHRGVESASFSYADSYLAGPESYALDPALPLVAGTLQTPAARSLFGAFTDSSPDRWGRMLIARAERVRAEAEGTTPRALSEVDLLLGVRDDLREGALRFRLDDEPYFRAAEDSGVPVLTDLPALLDIAARAESDGAGYDELRQLIRAGSSLGGARRVSAPKTRGCRSTNTGIGCNKKHCTSYSAAFFTTTMGNVRRVRGIDALSDVLVPDARRASGGA